MHQLNGNMYYCLQAISKIKVHTQVHIHVHTCKHNTKWLCKEITTQLRYGFAKCVSFYTSRHNLFDTCKSIAPWLKKKEKKKKKKKKKVMHYVVLYIRAYFIRIILYRATDLVCGGGL